MREEGVILPFIQPAWKVDRTVDIEDGNVEAIEREFKSLLSKAPYECRAPSPPGKLTLLGPYLKMTAYMNVYHHGAFCTTEALPLERMRENLEAKIGRPETVNFILAVASFMMHRGYEYRCHRVYVGQTSRDTGRLDIDWTPTRGGYEHIYTTVYLQDYEAPPEVKVPEEVVYEGTHITPPFNLS